MNNIFTPTSANPAEFIILDCLDEMIALEEVHRLACPDLAFHWSIKRMVGTIVELCVFRNVAKEEIDLYSKTNYFLAQLPSEMRMDKWRIYLVHADGGVDITDRRQDRRTVHKIVHDLAHNIRQQIEAYKLYDKEGNFLYEYDPIVPEGSLEIRLRRL